MTIKALENIVRDLQVTVTNLCNKVSALEQKICEQNTLILKQSEMIRSMSTTPTHDLENKSPITVKLAAERPVRMARLKATASLSTSQRSTIAKKQDNNIIKTGTSNAIMNATVKSDEVSRINPDPKPSITTPTMTTIAPNQLTPKGGATPPVDTAKLNSDLSSSNNNHTWITVGNKKGKKPKKIIICAGDQDDELLAVERKKYIQAWSFRPETTSDAVLKFLNKIHKSDGYSVEKRVIKTDTHSSFLIGIPETLYATFNSPAVWPPRVRFTEWFLRRPRAERGEPSSRAGAEQ